MTWSRRMKLYNRHVVGNQELLSISSDGDSSSRHEDEGEEEEEEEEDDEDDDGGKRRKEENVNENQVAGEWNSRFATRDGSSYLASRRSLPSIVYAWSGKYISSRSLEKRWRVSCRMIDVQKIMTSMKNGIAQSGS